MKTLKGESVFEEIQNPKNKQDFVYSDFHIKGHQIPLKLNSNKIK